MKRHTWLWVIEDGASGDDAMACFLCGTEADAASSLPVDLVMP